MSRKKQEFITGIINKNRRGFGFVTPDSGEGRDIFIPADMINGAMDGDKVLVRMAPVFMWEQSPMGFVVKVKERKLKEVCGVFYKTGNFAFVVPSDRKIKEDIFIPKKAGRNAKTGDYVVAEITKYPADDKSAEGKIIEILSGKDEGRGDILAVLRQRGCTSEFPLQAKKQAESIADKGISSDELSGREDLRNNLIITIDGRASKDFDDACSCRKLSNGNFLLGVHIADVSHYIREDSPLDLEAFKRGNSVYVIDQVIPMLPEELSDGLCSLNEGEDRLTLSVDMEISPEGEIKDYRIYESVIRSTHRMVYDDVSDILEKKDEKLIKKYEDVYPMLIVMNELKDILMKRRKEKGSLDFDIDEAHITLDKKGVPISVGVCERRSANKLIEEFMLAANRTVAEHFFWLRLPFVYRVHEKPETVKIQEFKTFLEGLSIRLLGESSNIHPKALNQVLDKVEGTSYENIVSTIMLRSMQKAFYSTECEGHFGLSMQYYCHFTSPIRRYPDLIIHRIIKEFLHGGLSDKRIEILSKKTEDAAANSSETERKAIEVERDIEKMKKAEYISKRIGDVYEGIISGVTQYGLYVELENTIEGLVSINMMHDDFYNVYPKQYKMIGELTGKTYALGQKVKIRVSDADKNSGNIDFILC